MSGTDIGYVVVRVDEDGDVVESLQRVEENHVPLLATYDEAVSVRGDRDPSWWQIAVVRVVEGDGDD